MPVLKILNCTFGLFNYSKTNCINFGRAHTKLSSKKFNFRKNNFSYKTDFQSTTEESKIASTDVIHSIPEKFIIKSKNNKTHPRDPSSTLRKSRNDMPVYYVKSPAEKNSSIIKKKLSPLQYKGEILHGIHPVYLALLQKKRNIFQLFLRTSNEESCANGNTKRKEEIENMARAQGIPICNVDSKGMKYLAPGVVHQVKKMLII